MFEENLMNQVAENITADIPDVMVENQAHQYLDNFKAQISRQFPYEEYKKMTGMDDAKLLEEAKEPALRQVKMDLATAAIIKLRTLRPAMRTWKPSSQRWLSSSAWMWRWSRSISPRSRSTIRS